MKFNISGFKCLFVAAAALIASGCSGGSVKASEKMVADDGQPQSADTAVSTPEPQLLTLALVGDIMMGTTFPDSVGGSHLPRNGGRNLFDDCRDMLLRADVAAGNLEGNLLDGPGRRRPMKNPATYFVFRMPTEYVGNLSEAGFDFLGLANNHMNDFGEPGRASTVKTLTDAGLAHA